LEIREVGMTNQTYDRTPSGTNKTIYGSVSGAVWPRSSGGTAGSAWSPVGALIVIALLACLTAAVLSPPPPEAAIGVGIGTD
jgi:hypothetical protein